MNWKIIRTYLVEVAGTSSLQEFFVSTHGDAECVNGLIPMMPCCSEDVTVLSVECLDLRLKESTIQVKIGCLNKEEEYFWSSLLSSSSQSHTRLRDRIPSTGRWKPIPRDFTTTRMSLSASLWGQETEVNLCFIPESYSDTLGTPQSPLTAQGVEE